MEGTRQKKKLVKDLNDVFTCKLCHGYIVDATTLVECFHTFCRGCILRHFESSKTQVQCPVCPVLYKKKSQCFREDTQIQGLIYKAVPTLYAKETQRREDFYRSTGVRAGSSCSDDSVIDRERDMMHELEQMMSLPADGKTQYLNQDDLISLSLEYYQAHLDTTDVSNNGDNNSKKDLNKITISGDSNCNSGAKNNGQIPSDSSDKAEASCDKRYLQCPAGVNMKHLQKFVRMKYGLTADHRVDIIYKGEVLPNDFSLMDVAYSFHWEKVKPMRFFYRIFTPMKIRPIKIVKTPTPTGGKQLQIVPVSTTTNHVTASKSPKQTFPESAETQKQVFSAREETESEQQDKERLMANLQLQSKSKALQQAEAKKLLQPAPEKIVKDCVFEYEEPDQEEIKRFAEKRDREWALQKKLEEETSADRDEFFSSYPSKKRKKSKHSKNDSNGHKEKKRKMHAEITNNDKSDLKLKVKITTNGHKHRHHKIESNSDISHKEKLLQMRQIRHKQSGDERGTPSIPTIKLPKVSGYLGEPEVKRKKDNNSKPPEYPNNKLYTNVVDNNNKPIIEKHVNKPMAIKPPLPSVEHKNTTRPVPNSSVIPSAKLIKKDMGSKVFDHSQKTFVKSAATTANKYSSKEQQKVSEGKVDSVKTLTNKVLPIGSITTNNKTLDRKIASLQQRCTIEPKNPAPNKSLGGGKNTGDKEEMVKSQYPPGFTVSKIESGVKRKDDSGEKGKGQRPSLEITLIPPANKNSEQKPVVHNKRPPPGTIPLERIKNAMNLKSGISIIPKMPDRTDNIGVLDLSKTSKSPEASPSRSSPKTEPPINGLNSMVNRQINNLVSRPMGSPGRATPENKTVQQLSNLQMLSKVASEHPTLNKLGTNNTFKSRPQMPNLQPAGKMLPTAIRSGLPPRMPPKLNEFPKFRPMNPQIRNLKPNQNQNIRNIPNPSLIFNRNQNLGQNRVSTSTDSVSEKKVASPKSSPVVAVSSTTCSSSMKEAPSVVAVAMDQSAVAEPKEISV